MLNQRFIRTLILFLVLLDLSLTTIGFFFPAWAFRVAHEADYIDPQAYFYRSAAMWLAFFILQLIALVRFPKESFWLLVVAGCRLADSFTDITVTLLAESLSILALVTFPIAGAGNVAIGVILIAYFKKLDAQRPPSGASG